jgi:hypothetical protein
MPSQLRHLFAIILIFGEPVKPSKLWDDHIIALCEDMQYQRYQVSKLPSNDIINSALLRGFRFKKDNNQNTCSIVVYVQVLRTTEWNGLTVPCVLVDITEAKLWENPVKCYENLVTCHCKVSIPIKS